MIKSFTVKQSRLKRLTRVRAKVKGTAKRPRFSVYRSNTSLAVEFIDDDKGVVLFSERINGKNIKKAIELGEKVALHAKKEGITNAVFDRSGYRYHGAVKALADTVREKGVTI